MVADGKPANEPNGKAPESLRREVVLISSDIWGTIEAMDGIALRNDEIEDAYLSQAGSYYQFPFGLYQRMMKRDDHIASLFKLRAASLLSRPWEIVAADESAKALELRDFVEYALEQIGSTPTDGYVDYGFEEDRRGLLSALIYGFAVFEIIWRQDGSYLVPATLKHRHCRRFVFDETGRMRLLTKDAPTKGIELPGYKFIIGRNPDDFDMPYGNSLARSGYFTSYLKLEAVKLWAFALERQACDVSVVTYEEGAGVEVVAEAERVARGLRRAVSLAIPNSILIDFKGAAREGTASAFEKFIQKCDEANTKLWLGGTLNVEQGDVGSYALGKVHADQLETLVSNDARWTSEVWNKQLIPYIVALNFGEDALALAPAMTVSLESKPDPAAVVEMIDKLSRLGLPIAQSYAYETLGIPEPMPDEALIKVPAPPPSPFALPGATPGDGDNPPELKKNELPAKDGAPEEAIEDAKAQA